MFEATDNRIAVPVILHCGRPLPVSGEADPVVAGWQGYVFQASSCFKHLYSLVAGPLLAIVIT